MIIRKITILIMIPQAYKKKLRINSGAFSYVLVEAQSYDRINLIIKLIRYKIHY